MTVSLSLFPVATPETAPFWEGVDLGILCLPKCRVCATWFFPPSTVCPNCTARDVLWLTASGRASLFSYVIAHRPLPEWNSSAPMSVCARAVGGGPAIGFDGRGLRAKPGRASARHASDRCVQEFRPKTHALLRACRGGEIRVKPGNYAIVGAAESTRIGNVPELSSTGLALDGAVNALGDAGLNAADIDGLTTGYLPPGDIAQLLGIKPQWVDGTVVGGCSWMFQLRNAVAAIDAGYCTTVLLTYGESGRSHGTLPCAYDVGVAGSTGQQFDLPYGGTAMQAALFGLPLVRYMREYGLTEEQLASVAVAQREWATLNPRAKLRERTTIREVLESPMIAWPLRRAMCCLVSDAGGAMVVVAADRARDFPKPPVYLLGSGAAVETGIVSPAGIRDPPASRTHPDIVAQCASERRYHPRGHRSRDDLRRLRSQPHIRARGIGLRGLR